MSQSRNGDESKDFQNESFLDVLKELMTGLGLTLLGGSLSALGFFLCTKLIGAMPGAFLIYNCFPILMVGLAQVLDSIIKLAAKLIDNTFGKVIGLATGKDISLEKQYNNLKICLKNIYEYFIPPKAENTEEKQYGQKVTSH